MLFHVEFCGGEKGSQVEKLNVRRNRIQHQQQKVGSGVQTCRSRGLKTARKKENDKQKRKDMQAKENVQK